MACADVVINTQKRYKHFFQMFLVGNVVRFSVIILFVELVEKTYSQSGVTNNDLGPLYEAVVKTLAYLGDQHQSLDTDALLGLRIAEGMFVIYIVHIFSNFI